jgi:hypothetical protein
MRKWRLLTPCQALVDLAATLGFHLPAKLADAAIAALLAVPLLLAVRRFHRNRDSDAALLVVLAFLAITSLVLAGHTWPWFLLWPLAVATLIWQQRLARVLLTLFLLAPFVHLYWILEQPAWRNPRLATLGFYGAFFLLVWPCWHLLGTHQDENPAPSIPATSNPR